MTSCYLHSPNLFFEKLENYDRQTYGHTDIHTDIQTDRQDLPIKSPRRRLKMNNYNAILKHTLSHLDLTIGCGGLNHNP